MSEWEVFAYGVGAFLVVLFGGAALAFWLPRWLMG